MKFILWFKLWAIRRQLNDQYLAQKMCREDITELALSIPETEREFREAKQAYFRYGLCAPQSKP